MVEEIKDKPMPNDNPTEVLMRGYCTMDASALDRDFVCYVRVGNEVIARTKNGGYISYFKVRG